MHALEHDRPDQGAHQVCPRVGEAVERRRGRDEPERAVPRVRHQSRDDVRVAAALSQQRPRCAVTGRALASTAPQPRPIAPEMADALVAARKQRPTWGPRKLRAFLVDRNPGVHFPSESAIAAILQRNGLTGVHRRRRHRLVVPSTRPFAAATGPNAVWCVDFKGWWRTQDGRRCYPLTLLDAYSRTCSVARRCSIPTRDTCSPSSIPRSRNSGRPTPSAPTTDRRSRRSAPQA